MIRVLAIVALLTAASRLSAQRPADRWFGADKVKHATTSAVVSNMTFAAARAVGQHPAGAGLTAASVAAVVGVAKEVVDRRSGKPFSLKDLGWDALGAAGALAVLHHAR